MEQIWGPKASMSRRTPHRCLIVRPCSAELCWIRVRTKGLTLSNVNAKVEEMLEKVEEVGEEVEAEMSESVPSGIDQVGERVFLI